MSAKVISFKRVREEKIKEKKKKEIKESTSVHTKSLYDLYQDILEDVLSEWESAASKNNLSEYIYKKLPILARSRKTDDYVNDLNIIARVESKVDIKFSVFSPGTTRNNEVGWIAVFHRGPHILGTPPMASESNARILNVILYLVYDSLLRSLGK